MGPASREALDRQARLAGNGASLPTGATPRTTASRLARRGLRTESHSVLWLEGRARQAQREQATKRTANGNYEVAP